MTSNIRLRPLTAPVSPSPTDTNTGAPHHRSFSLKKATRIKLSTAQLLLLFTAMAVLALLLVLLLAFLGHIDGVRAKNILMPAPDAEHKYKSAVASFSLVDFSRKDPWDTAENRKIMLTIFMPIPEKSCSECAVPYMPDQTAKINNEQFLGDRNKGVFEQMQYKACCSASGTIDAAKIPLVLVDGHTDTSRLVYSNLARYVAANNVVVVLIDHPHDSSIVEFEDKSIAYNSGRTSLSNLSPLTSWNATVTKAIDIRIQDIKFALTSLADLSLLTRSFSAVKFSSALSTSSYAIVGHGLGGTVATQLGVADPRVRFSINLSGSAPPITQNTAAPVYFIGRENFLRDNDINWPAAWPHLTGPATEFDLQDSEIMDFTDASVVLELAQREGGMAGLQAKGLGKQGVWANHAVKCFVEGIVKDELKGDGKAVSNCVRIFGDERMVPYAARLKPKIEPTVTPGDKESGAASLRWRRWFA